MSELIWVRREWREKWEMRVQGPMRESDMMRWRREGSERDTRGDSVARAKVQVDDVPL
jgi:hypothetical protein